ncbi:MAG: TolC family protein, partial [Elusimicrobiota bacterium]|nr:TolC family protein [Elusimicrobiota bacterium]
MKFLKFILFILFILFLFSININLLAKTKILTLDEALDLAKENNPDLKILRLELKELKNSISQNRTQMFPKFYLTGQDTNQNSFESNIVFKDFQFKSELVPTKIRRYDLNISGEQKLLDFTYISKINSLKKRYEAEYSGYLQKIQDVSLNVANVYYTLMKYEQTKKILEEDVGILEKHLKSLENKFNMNLETQKTILNLIITINNKKQELYNVTQLYYTNKMELSGLLEIPMSDFENFEVLDFEGLESVKTNAFTNSQKSINMIFNKALNKRKDMQKLILTNYSIIKEKSSVKKGFLPVFSVQGNYGYLNEEKFSNDPEDRYWSVVFVGKLNLFDGGYQYLKIKELNLKLNKNEQEIKNFAKKLSIEIEKIIFYIEIQEKMYLEAKKNLEATLKNLRIARSLLNKKQIRKDE